MLLSRDADEDDSGLQNNKYLYPSKKFALIFKLSNRYSTPSVNWTDGIRDWLSPIDATLTDSYLWT